MSIQNRLKRWFKLRFAILYPFGVFVVLFAAPDDNSMRAGMGFIITGLLIRIWANGYAIKLAKLTTFGPYAFVRHPLYLGTMLIALGFIVILKIYYIGILFLIIMAIVYYKTIKNEDGMLENKFGEIYIDYKKKIPAIIPCFFPYRKGEKWPFSFKRLIQSQEYKLFLWIIVLVFVFYLKEEFLVEKEGFDVKKAGFIIGAFLLGMLDLTGEFLKWRKRKHSLNS